MTVAKKAKKAKAEKGSISLTKQKLLELYATLISLAKLQGVRFTYAMSKNIRLIKGEVEDLKDIMKPVGKDDKETEEKVKLLQKYSDDLHDIKMGLCNRDKKGEPILRPVPNGSYDYDIPYSRLKLAKEKEEELQNNDEYKEIYAEQEKKLEGYKEVLKEEYSFIPYLCDADDVDPKVTTAQMEQIFDLIRDPDE